MSIKEIMDKTEHRPWKIPSQNWKYYQEWNNVVFLHWPVNLVELKKIVPKKIEIDLFEGIPWVSLVAFTMENIRPRILPTFYPVSNFDEINIRTYVKMNNKTGVYFLSIEGSKWISCKIAKGLSALPYIYSKMDRDENHYRSKNRKYGDSFNVQYSVGGEIKIKTHVDTWLTERYALFQDTEKFIKEYEIHHIEWPIQEIEIDALNINYPRFTELIDEIPKKMHFSKGVQVIAW